MVQTACPITHSAVASCLAGLATAARAPPHALCRMHSNLAAALPTPRLLLAQTALPRARQRSRQTSCKQTSRTRLTAVHQLPRLWKRQHHMRQPCLPKHKCSLALELTARHGQQAQCLQGHTTRHTTRMEYSRAGCHSQQSALQTPQVLHRLLCLSYHQAGVTARLQVWLCARAGGIATSSSADRHHHRHPHRQFVSRSQTSTEEQPCHHLGYALHDACMKASASNFRPVQSRTVMAALHSA